MRKPAGVNVRADRASSPSRSKTNNNASPSSSSGSSTAVVPKRRARLLLLIAFAALSTFILIAKAAQMIGEGGGFGGVAGSISGRRSTRRSHGDDGSQNSPFPEGNRHTSLVAITSEEGEGGGHSNSPKKKMVAVAVKPTAPVFVKKSPKNKGQALLGIVVKDAVPHQSTTKATRAPTTTKTTTTTTTTTTTSPPPSAKGDGGAAGGGEGNRMIHTSLRGESDSEGIAVRDNGEEGRRGGGEAEAEEDEGDDSLLTASLDSILGDCRGADQTRSMQSIGGGAPPLLLAADKSQTPRRCDPTRCRFCQHFPPHASPHRGADLTPGTVQYLRRHVLFAVVTGSFGNFSRLDLAYCTWLQLVPEENLYLISDIIPSSAPMHNSGDGPTLSAKESNNSSYRRAGQWVSGAVPRGHNFSSKQKGAVGYTIDWHKAQFRFMLGVDVMLRRALRTGGRQTSNHTLAESLISSSSLSSSEKVINRLLADDADGDEGEEEGEGVKGLTWVPATAGENGKAQPYAFPPLPPTNKNKKDDKEFIKWTIVVDDDTFVNLNALVVYFKRMDAAEASERRKRKLDASRQEEVKEGKKKGDERRSEEAVASAAVYDEEDDSDTPIYIGDKGWGGAGHYFNRAANKRLQQDLFSKCIVPHMMRNTRASDEALVKCLPHLGGGGGVGGGSKSQSLPKPTDHIDGADGDAMDGKGAAGGEGGVGDVAMKAVVVSPPPSPFLLPRMRIINDRLFSHCQANFLRERLLRGDHISAHIKRDVTGPIPLQSLRIRLYYQTVYHGTTINKTCPFRLLMHFGACAYGSSCKLKRCDAEHDATALRDYELLMLQSPEVVDTL